MTNSNKAFWSPKQVYDYLSKQSSTKQPMILPDDAYCTENFTWNEVLRTKPRNISLPSIGILENLKYSTEVLQVYRTKIGKKIEITSSWRTPAEQKELIQQYKAGLLENMPSETSLHMEGLAVDISVVDGSDKELQNHVNDTFAGEAEFGWNYTHLGLTTFSKSYLQRHGLFRNDIYKKLVLDTTKLSKTQRDAIEKRINPANWNIRYPSTFDPIKNAEFFKNSSISRTNANNLPLLPEIKIPLQNADESVVDTDNTTYLQGHIEINVNKDETTNSEQGFSTGLAADLFSEEEIEDLKERMEYERLPKETLKKMGKYHKRKFNEKIRETYSGDFKDLTLANFVKDGEFTFIPHDIEPKQSKPTPPSTKHPQPETDKIDLSKDEKWQSFRKIFRTFFGMPDDDGKPMGKINSTDIYNALDVMDTMKNAMHESEITQSFEQKNEFEDSMQFEFTSDEVQAKTMQNALQQGSEQIKSEVKTEILDEISRQTMFPDRDYVEDIIRDVFDSVSYRRGYKISDN